MRHIPTLRLGATRGLRPLAPRLQEGLGAGLGLLVATVVVRVLLPSVAVSWPFTDRALVRADDVLLGLLQLVALALSAWLAFGALATVLGLLPGALGRTFRGIGHAITPRLVRQGLTMVLSAAVGSAALPTSAAGRDVTTSTGEQNRSGDRPDAPSPAFTTTAPSAPDPSQSATNLPSPGFTPGDSSTSLHVPSPALRPTPGPTPPAPAGPGFRPTKPVPVHPEDRTRLLAPSPRFGSAVADLVVVRKGDSLWSIAAAQLGPDATDAQIARAWPRWYAANREAIGADPDLILPGMQLRAPEEGA